MGKLKDAFTRADVKDPDMHFAENLREKVGKSSKNSNFLYLHMLWNINSSNSFFVSDVNLKRGRQLGSDCLNF